LKGEDFEKFKKDQVEPEILEKHKRLDRMTIRSKAAKTIEKISSTLHRNLTKV
jgi:hypothetical protein